MGGFEAIGTTQGSALHCLQHQDSGQFPPDHKAKQRDTPLTHGTRHTVTTGLESTLPLNDGVRGMVTLPALELSMASSPTMLTAPYQETVGLLGLACLSRLHVDRL